MRLASRIHQVLIPSSSNSNASRESSRIVHKPHPQRSVLQAQTGESQSIHRACVAHTHPHAPTCARRDIDLFHKRHLANQIRCLLVTLLPALDSSTLGTGVPRLALAVLRHSLTVHPYPTCAQQQHKRRDEQQHQNAQEATRDQPALPAAALPLSVQPCQRPGALVGIEDGAQRL